MTAFPEYGGLLLDGEFTRGEVLRQAGGWLVAAGARGRNYTVSRVLNKEISEIWITFLL
jgi:hypothetical protein